MNTGYNKTIYTYLEANCHEYLNLCIKTWYKNLPDGYKIVVLTQENIQGVLPESVINSLFSLDYREKKLPYFVDYLAASVLFFNGGIFLDADTIVTEKFFPQEILLRSTNLILFSDGANNVCSGFMMANKNAPVLEELIRRYTFAKYLPAVSNSRRNFIINDTIKDFKERDALLLDCEASGYYMEKTIYGMGGEYLYQKYYFSNICSVRDFFEHTKGIVALHNSLTPEKYKHMGIEEFLKQDILLSKILKSILTEQMS